MGSIRELISNSPGCAHRAAASKASSRAPQSLNEPRAIITHAVPLPFASPSNPRAGFKALSTEV